MADLYDTTITFQTSEESDRFFNGLGYRPFPINGRRALVLECTDDFGNPIMTFARQHLADPLTFTLSDVARKAA